LLTARLMGLPSIVWDAARRKGGGGAGRNGRAGTVVRYGKPSSHPGKFRVRAKKTSPVDDGRKNARGTRRGQPKKPKKVAEGESVVKQFGSKTKQRTPFGPQKRWKTDFRPGDRMPASPGAGPGWDKGAGDKQPRLLWNRGGGWGDILNSVVSSGQRQKKIWGTVFFYFISKKPVVKALCPPGSCGCRGFDGGGGGAAGAKGKKVFKGADSKALHDGGEKLTFRGCLGRAGFFSVCGGGKGRGAARAPFFRGPPRPGCWARRGGWGLSSPPGPGRRGGGGGRVGKGPPERGGWRFFLSGGGNPSPPRRENKGTGVLTPSQAVSKNGFKRGRWVGTFFGGAGPTCFFPLSGWDNVSSPPNWDFVQGSTGPLFLKGDGSRLEFAEGGLHRGRG